MSGYVYTGPRSSPHHPHAEASHAWVQVYLPEEGWVGFDPTNGIVGQIFGVRYMAMLTGVTFFSHQIGSFLGAWLGGLMFDRTGLPDPLLMDHCFTIAGDKISVLTCRLATKADIASRTRCRKETSHVLQHIDLADPQSSRRLR